MKPEDYLPLWESYSAEVYSLPISPNNDFRGMRRCGEMDCGRRVGEAETGTQVNRSLNHVFFSVPSVLNGSDCGMNT